MRLVVIILVHGSGCARSIRAGCKFWKTKRDVGVGGSDSLASIQLGKYGVCVSQLRQLSDSERSLPLLGPHKYLFVNMWRMVGLASKIPDCDTATKYLTGTGASPLQGAPLRSQAN
jgi:hypothetical protein